MLREAEALAVSLDDPRRLGQVSLSLSNHFYFMGTYGQAIAAAQRALALATAHGETVLQARAHQFLGVYYQARGDYGRAIDCFGQTMVSLNEAQHRECSGRPSYPLWSHMVPGSLCAMPSWGCSSRAGLWEKKGSGLPRRLRTPSPSIMFALMWELWAPIPPSR